MRLLAFWQAHASELGHLVAQHVALVVLSTAAALALGVPLGIVAAKRPRLGAPLLWASPTWCRRSPAWRCSASCCRCPSSAGSAPARRSSRWCSTPCCRSCGRRWRASQGIDPAVREAAVAMGMRPFELLRLVELPLAWPSMLAGIRVATVVGVGTATIAAAIGAGGLGEYIFRGLSMVDATVILAGAVPSAALALLADGALALLQRRTRGRRRRGRRRSGPRRGRARAGDCRRRLARAHVPAHGRGRRRVEELHRADHPGRAAGADARAVRRAAGRPAAEPGRHVHLRPGACGRARSTSTSSTRARR